jgi:uncharacterized membrane protein YeaQ/YmgE (transglycosylase-associated protein family)
MNIIIYLVVAAVIGWIASEIMHDRASLLINIIVAVVGCSILGQSTMRLTFQPCW